LKGKSISKNLNLEEIAKLTNGFTGSDLNSLCKRAAFIAVEENFSNLTKNSQEEERENIEIEICQNHFLEALPKIKPTITNIEINFLKNWKR